MLPQDYMDDGGAPATVSPDGFGRPMTQEQLASAVACYCFYRHFHGDGRPKNMRRGREGMVRFSRHCIRHKGGSSARARHSTA